MSVDCVTKGRLEQLSGPAVRHHVPRRRSWFPIFPFRFFGWSNDDIDIRQINRRENIFILYVQKPHENVSET